MTYDSGRQSTTQTIAFTGTSVGITTAFGAQTRQIRLIANAACNYVIGDGTQTATTGSPYLGANWFEYITVTPGQKIAAIEAATNGLTTATPGTLWITEIV